MNGAATSVAADKLAITKEVTAGSTKGVSGVSGVLPNSGAKIQGVDIELGPTSFAALWSVGCGFGKFTTALSMAGSFSIDREEDS